LRALHLKGEPVDFFADAVGDGYFSQVVIGALDVTEHAGELDQFTWRCEVAEYVEPPQPASPLSDLGQLDTDLLNEAASFMNDVQNAVEQARQLADMLTNLPSFGDPTGPLRTMPTTFVQIAGGDALNSVGALRDLLR
jgi:hypothetical protein